MCGAVYLLNIYIKNRRKYEIHRYFYTALSILSCLCLCICVFVCISLCVCYCLLLFTIVYHFLSFLLCFLSFFYYFYLLCKLRKHSPHTETVWGGLFPQFVMTKIQNNKIFIIFLYYLFFILFCWSLKCSFGIQREGTAARHGASRRAQISGAC